MQQLGFAEAVDAGATRGENMLEFESSVNDEVAVEQTGRRCQVQEAEHLELGFGPAC